MPYKSERIIIAHSKKDRRIKLSDADREEIRNLTGLSINEIARRYGVNKRLIQFILFPERLARNKQLRKERGGSKIYYDRQKQAEYTRKHRRYKHELYMKGEIK